jgi:hypothetical protein
LQYRESDNTVLARVSIYMAGLLAEQKFFADVGNSHKHRLAEASPRAIARKRTTNGAVISSKYEAFGSQRRASATDGATLGLQRS